MSTTGMAPPPPPSAQQPPPGWVPGEPAVAAPNIRPVLRKVVVALLWVTVVIELSLGVAAYSRKRTFDGVVDGRRPIAELRDADEIVGMLAWSTAAATLVTAIMLAVWSYRIVKIARTRRADARPVLAAAGWFIPIGNLWVPWSQLRRSLQFSFESAAIGWWQALWIVGSVTLNLSLRTFNDSNPFQTAGDVSNSLRNQSIGILIGTTILAAAACFAMRAMRGLDDDANTRR